MPRLRALANAPTERRTVKVSLNADLVREARDYHLNLSVTLERALVAQLRQSRAERWLAENKDGIAAYNALVEHHGAFADTLRNV
jgi:antitoxin CcdA